MRERPILFSDPMVRAILAGHKTQTRRVVTKPLDFIGAGGKDGEEWNDPNYWGWEDGENNPGSFFVLGRNPPHPDVAIGCPYGEPGDRLWVREAWCPLERCDWLGSDPKQNVNHRADSTPETESIRREMGYRWRPSIHMPRWASRITLEITSIRVERVQAISNIDAKEEGFVDSALVFKEGGSTARDAFARLWDSINAKRGYGWDKNPWVWVVAFAPLITDHRPLATGQQQ